MDMEPSEEKVLKDFISKMNEVIRRIERMEVEIEKGQNKISENLGETKTKIESHIQDWESWRDKAWQPVRDEVKHNSTVISIIIFVGSSIFLTGMSVMGYYVKMAIDIAVGG